MRIETLRLTELNPASYNPRKELKPEDPEFEKLKRSITEFGYVELIVVNERTGNTVISGHQRLSVMKTLGIEDAECVIVDLPPEKEKALNIAMNKISGEWDEKKLALVISDLEAADFDVSLTGFDAAELDNLFRRNGDEPKDDGYDPTEELSKPKMTHPGDIWTLGRHRLICGDSTDPLTYERLMADRKANLVITDPPYNVAYEGTAGKIRNDDMKDDQFYLFLLAAFSLMEKFMEDDASIYVFHADTEGLNFRKAFSEAGFYLSGTCIWKKNALVLGRSPYQWQHEPVLYGWKKKGKHQWYTGRKESTIWEFDRPKRNADHPTMKPVPLIAYPMQNSSMSGTLVLDPFGGSGSTLIAAEETGRVCYTAELDEKYADVIVKRYIELKGNAEDVRLERDGLTYTYDEAVSMMEGCGE